MSDVLTALVERALGARSTVRPRVWSTFEPPYVEPPEPAPARARLEAVAPEPAAGPDAAAGQAPSRRAPAAPARAVRASAAAPAADAGPARVAARGSGWAAAGERPHPAELFSDEGARRVERVELPRGNADARTHANAGDGLEAARAVRGATPEPADAADAAEPAPEARPRRAVESAARASGPIESRAVERRSEVVRPATAIAPRREPSPPEHAPAGERDERPVVRVHIDRIEVRGGTPPAPPRAPRAREPRVSLDDYLERTARGRRE